MTSITNTNISIIVFIEEHMNTVLKTHEITKWKVVNLIKVV